MNLPVLSGRTCVPVRLLPFLTNWDLLPPDVVAQLFASNKKHPLLGFRLVSFNLDSDGKVNPVRSAFWVNYALDLEQLGQQFSQSDQGHQAWRAQAVKLQPAGVFVWLDDLQTVIGRRHQLTSRLSGNPEAPNDELDLQPPVSPAELAVVFDGFNSFLPGQPGRGRLTNRSNDGGSARSAGTTALPLELPAKVIETAEWMAKAREEAKRVVKSRAAKGWFPSQMVIAEEVADTFRRQGVMGVDGKPLSAGTIKRHALKGILDGVNQHGR